MRHFSLRFPSVRTIAAFAALAAGMAVLNFSLPRHEPAAVLLLWAAFCVFRAYLAGTLAYLAASAVFLSRPFSAAVNLKFSRPVISP